jgi:hypothetical protein
MTSREHGTQSCDGLAGLNGDLVCAHRVAFCSSSEQSKKWSRVAQHPMTQQG